MEYYGKIDTLFERKDDFSVDLSKFRRPEFALLNRWHVTEKVDGTSTVIHFDRYGASIGGRTAKSNMTEDMQESLRAVARSAMPVSDILTRHGLETLTVYGELYGPKIQNGGNYSDSLEFRAFDIKAGESFLSPDQFFACANDLGIPTVPLLGDVATLDEIVEYVRSGPMSTFAKRPVASEGIIAKSPVELRNNAGKRLMWKLKHIDFKAGKR